MKVCGVRHTTMSSKVDLHQMRLASLARDSHSNVMERYWQSLSHHHRSVSHAQMTVVYEEISVSSRGGVYGMASSEPSLSKPPPDKQFLSCGICQERYSRPKVLPCLHTFCEHCLTSYIPPASLSVTCPICRQQSILPEQGVSALQNNPVILQLIDVLDHPNVCTNGDTGSESSCLVCPSHDGQPLDFYCSTCETAVCESCTEMEHSTHPTVPSDEAIAEHRDILGTLLEGAQAQVPTLQNAIALVQQVSATLEDNYKQTQARIQETFKELAQLVEKRKDLLLTELDQAYHIKEQTLSEQQGTLEGLLTSIESCSDITESTLNRGNNTEILLVRKEMTEKLTQLSTPDIQKLPEENGYLFFNDSDLSSVKKLLNGIGSVQTNSAVAFETVAKGEALKRCYAGRESVVNITTKDRNGDLIRVGHSSFAADLQLNDGTMIIPDILDNKNGTYDLTYVAEMPGTYKLDVRLYGQSIKGSPFKIKAYSETDSADRSAGSSKIPKTSAVKQRGTKRPSSSRSHGSNRKSNPIEDDLLLRIGVKGRGKGEFTNPQGVCAKDGKVLVADSNNQCVQVFTDTGDFKLRFGIRGRNAGQMQRPTGVAVTINGNYLIADYDNKWVSIFSPEGKYLNKIGTGKLLGPKGVCVDKNGHIIVVDNRASCVFIFQSNGKLLHKFGSRGNDEHQFAGPHFCAVNEDNDIIVSDFHNHCVKVFNSEGTFQYSFGSNGEGNGQFNAPTGVAVDRLGNILVADWGNSRIQVFDSQGSFLSYINTTADPLYGPQGLTMTEEGSVVVSDSGNHCVKVYRYLQ